MEETVGAYGRGCKILKQHTVKKQSEKGLKEGFPGGSRRGSV